MELENSTELLEDRMYKKVGIKAITKAKTEPTYDFQVQDDHSFLLENNIISSNSVEYVPSISLRITKGKIKPTDLEELGFLYGGEIPKHLNSLGIVSRIELYKSRFTRPFRKVQLMIPYDMGLHKHAGLFTYLYDNDIIVSENRKGYYNYKLAPFEKDFTRKKFIEDGYADEIMKDLLEREKNGEVFDFIMKSAEDIAREKEANKDTISEEINDSVKG